MIKINPVHYDIICKNLLEYFNENQKEIFSAINQALSYCGKERVSVGYAGIYMTVNDGIIRIYHNEMLVYENDIADGFEPSSFTEAFLKNTNMERLEEMERSILKIGFASIYLAYSIENNNLKAKRQKGTFYINYKLKGSEITLRKYEAGTNLFVIRETAGKISFMRNYKTKDCYTFPSALYQMPNKGKMSCFHPGNMEELDDGGRLDKALDGVPLELGKCYSNAEKIIGALHNDGYEKEHTVEYYGGWILQANGDKLIHHAWVVIDGKSIIDASIKKCGKFHSYLETIERGIYMPFSRDLLADWIRQEEEEKASFSKYHFYGKIDTCIYVGTQCTSEEARKSFRSTMQRNPDMPGYDNIDKQTAQNKLQEIYYRKYGKKT